MGGELAYSSIHTFTSFVNSQHATIVMYVLGLTTQKSVCDTTADYVGFQKSLRMLQNVHSWKAQNWNIFWECCPQMARPPLGYSCRTYAIITFPQD